MNRSLLNLTFLAAICAAQGAQASIIEEMIQILKRGGTGSRIVIATVKDSRIGEVTQRLTQELSQVDKDTKSVFNYSDSPDFARKNFRSRSLNEILATHSMTRDAVIMVTKLSEASPAELKGLSVSQIIDLIRMIRADVNNRYYADLFLRSYIQPEFGEKLIEDLTILASIKAYTSEDQQILKELVAEERLYNFLSKKPSVYPRLADHIRNENVDDFMEAIRLWKWHGWNGGSWGTDTTLKAIFKESFDSVMNGGLSIDRYAKLSVVLLRKDLHEEYVKLILTNLKNVASKYPEILDDPEIVQFLSNHPELGDQLAQMSK
jgi:hypothetical protein